MNHALASSISKESGATVPEERLLYSVSCSERVCLEIVPNCARKTLQAIIRGKVEPDSVIHSESWRRHVGYKKHYRVHHGNNELAKGESHINGTESFWSFAKRRFIKFYRNTNIYKCLLRDFKNKSLY